MSTPVSTAESTAVSPQAERLARLLKLTERREPAVAQVATWVGLGIIEGRLHPGQDLNTVDLAKRFASSRTPIREALMVLEQEGLVEIRARRRPRVALFSIEQVRHIYEVREQLLALLARLVVARASDEELAALRADVTAMRRHVDTGDVDAYFWAHVSLQETMTELAGNPTLKGILDGLALRTLILRRLSLLGPHSLGDSASLQERVQGALEERDAELAAILLARTARAALRSIENAYAAGEPAWPSEA
jgi:DNA-binding GntR family transcriptional regulator